MRNKKMQSICFFVLVFGFSYVAHAQTKKLSGRVESAVDHRPISSASITFDVGRNGKITDETGQYLITVPADAKQMIVSSIGFSTKTIDLQGVNDTLTILMNPSSEDLADVIVTSAGGLKTKIRAQGYNATVLSGDKLNAAKSVSVGNALQGKAPGLLVSNTSGGVNPNYRIVLRGQRSLTGNNQALIVLDNIVVPNDYLANLNPNDIESINVLNGSSAAALYGSSASNGALIITTKKGKSGVTNLNVTHTTTVEAVAFFPKLQDQFGPGGTGYGTDQLGNPYYVGYENGSYGPRFNGSQVQLGDTLEDGSRQMVPYSANNSREDFWDKGLTNQTDFSISSGDEHSTFILSGQYVDATGTSPGDQSKRVSARLGGTRKLWDGKLLATYSLSLTQKRTDLTTETGNMYANMLEVPALVPLTNYKNWRTDPFASPNGYYNPWYLNPYFYADNYRQKYRNDLFTGSLQLDYNPLEWLGFTYRIGLTSNNTDFKGTVGAFKYSEFAKEQSGGSKSDIAASVADGNAYWATLVSDFQIHLSKKINDLNFNLTLGDQINQNKSKGTTVGASGLVVPNLYNVSNLIGTPSAVEGNYLTRQVGVYADLKVSYKNFLYLEATGRNDWVSILLPQNRSIFYPGVNLSFIPTDAFPGLKNNGWLDYLKIRGGISKTGQVNLGSYTGDYPTYGAYNLYPTFSQTHGFPYGNTAGFTLNDKIVSSDLKPEFTKAWEAGFDVEMFKNRVSLNATWFSSRTNNQTVTTGISSTTGFTSYLVNSGETYSQGAELALQLAAVSAKDWGVDFSINYTYNDNGVNSIATGLSKLAIATYGGNSGSYAIPGQAFPVILGYDYDRDPKGRIIVDQRTGNPTKSDTLSILGSASPKNTIGITPSIRYKNFRLTAVFDYRGGYQVYNNGAGELDWSGSGYRTGIYNRERFVIPNSVYLDAASGQYVPNKDISVRAGNEGFWTDNNNNWGVDVNYITSGDFWKLRELTLAYTVPTSVLSKIGFIKSANISLIGRNLFVWLPKNNYFTDPEYSDAGNTSNGIGLTGLGQTPPSRFYGGSISINF